MTIDGRPGRLRVDVADLRLRPGTTRPVQVVTTLDDVDVAEVRVPEGAPVELDLVLEAVQGGIDVTGTITAPWVGPCRRCLDPVTGTMVADVHEIFADDHVEGETYPIHRDSIDLREMTRDLVALGLPLAPLCRPDCPGPAPEGFPVEVEHDEDPSGGRDRPKDPRWAALDELRAQFESEGEPPDSDEAGEVG